MARSSLDQILKAINAGKSQPIYLVSGDLVLAEPQGQKIAEALAEKVGCEVERQRRPATLAPLLSDLRTYSLFASAKVIMAVDSAVMADRNAAAHLIDQAEEGLPIADTSEELAGSQREAASRLLQALHVFGVDPYLGEAAEPLKALPEWAFQGGPARRKRKSNRPRGKKQVATLREGLITLLEAARVSGLEGFAEGDLAELGVIQEKGLPEGHSLVLVEQSVAEKHPLLDSLQAAGAALNLARVSTNKSGDWGGLDPLLAELEKETGSAIAKDAVAELAKRTLRQKGEWKKRTVEADSTARFAAEYRKLAGLAEGRITKAHVRGNVEDRGEEDVWQILDALGGGRGGEALDRFRRLIASADDTMAARLSFFALLAGFCRQLSAVVGSMKIARVPPGERSYQRFQSRHAPALQAPLPTGAKNPLAGLHPYRLHRSYLAASALDPSFASRLPHLVLETEMRIKGESSDADAAISELLARVAGAISTRRR